MRPLLLLVVMTLMLVALLTFLAAEFGDIELPPGWVWIGPAA